MQQNLLIKVCGIKFPENQKAVSELGIDLMGFIFYPKSKRYVGNLPDVEQNELFNTTILKVGVFVNEKIKTIINTGNKYGLNYIQLHGTETPEFCRKIRLAGFNCIKAFGVNESFDFNITLQYSDDADYFLFDTKTILHGGSGKKFNWNKLSEYKGKTPFILSGGIKPDDAENIRSVFHSKMAGIDLNSGFEDQPGVKNIVLLRKFIEKIKA